MNNVAVRCVVGRYVDSRGNGGANRIGAAFAGAFDAEQIERARRYTRSLVLNKYK
jgi:hypothetical protein